jgi:HTH-type transcriptional regulator/antitoxin HigA
MISPGQAVRHLLSDRGWTQADLASILDRPTQWVSEVCCDKKSITPRAALALEAASGGFVDAPTWLGIQSRWQLALLDGHPAALEAIRVRAATREAAER